MCQNYRFFASVGGGQYKTRFELTRWSSISGAIINPGEDESLSWTLQVQIPVRSTFAFLLSRVGKIGQE